MEVGAAASARRGRGRRWSGRGRRLVGPRRGGGRRRGRNRGGRRASDGCRGRTVVVVDVAVERWWSSWERWSSVAWWSSSERPTHRALLGMRRRMPDRHASAGVSTVNARSATSRLTGPRSPTSTDSASIPGATDPPPAVWSVMTALSPPADRYPSGMRTTSMSTPDRARWLRRVIVPSTQVVSLKTSVMLLHNWSRPRATPGGGARSPGVRLLPSGRPLRSRLSDAP